MTELHQEIEVKEAIRGPGDQDAEYQRIRIPGKSDADLIP